MIALAIDSVVLIFLLQTINKDEIGFGTAFLVALATSLGTTLLAIGLTIVMGMAGILVAALVAAVLLGIAVSALFGVEIKRSFTIAGLFMLVHIGVSIGLHLLLSSAS